MPGEIRWWVTVASSSSGRVPGGLAVWLTWIELRRWLSVTQLPQHPAVRHYVQSVRTFFTQAGAPTAAPEAPSIPASHAPIGCLAPGARPSLSSGRLSLRGGPEVSPLPPIRPWPSHRAAPPRMDALFPPGPAAQGRPLTRKGSLKRFTFAHSWHRGTRRSVTPRRCKSMTSVVLGPEVMSSRVFKWFSLSFWSTELPLPCVSGPGFRIPGQLDVPFVSYGAQE